MENDSQIVRQSLVEHPPAGDFSQAGADLLVSIRKAAHLIPTPFSAPDPTWLQQLGHATVEVAQAAGAVAQFGWHTVNDTEVGRTIRDELTIGTVRETLGLAEAIYHRDGGAVARKAMGAGSRIAADVTIYNLARRPRMTTKLLSLLFKGPPGQPPERG